MTTPTHLPYARRVRCVDTFDVAVAEAMILQALGPDSGAMLVHRRDGQLIVELTPQGCDALVAMAASQDEDANAEWMELLTVGLIDEAVAAAGPSWRAEAELGVELLAAVRADDMAAVGCAALQGPLVVDTARTLRQILHDSVCDPNLVRFL